ncbi:MAG: thiol-activated cytolysin family protein [Granulosicoccus sp.]
MKTRQVGISAIALTLTMLVACSEDGEIMNDPGGPSADFNDEVYGHSSWSEFSPLLEPRNSPTGNSEDNFLETIDGREYMCSTTEYSMTDTPAEFISMQPDSSVIWLGNLIQGDSHVSVGSLNELSIGDRAPLNISLDILFSGNSRTVENPSLSTVNAAIGEMISDARAANIEGPVDAFYEEKEAHSTSQTALELGFTAEYLGASVVGALEVDKRVMKKVSMPISSRKPLPSVWSYRHLHKIW